MHISSMTNQPLRAGSLVSAVLAATLALCIASADAAEPKQGAAGNVAASVNPKATVQELMVEIGAASEKIWNAVSVVTDASGTHERTPSTPAQWKELRGQALRLAEMSKLLMTPGRPVAGPNVKTTVTSMEPLDVAAIQQRLDANPAALAGCAQSVRTVAMQLVAAADRRNVQKFSELGGSLDEIAENCHKTFWYPDQK
ncbi:MAG: hypothetical protein ACEQSK_06670 [Sphingomonadaceae bacterium]